MCFKLIYWSIVYKFTRFRQTAISILFDIKHSNGIVYLCWHASIHEEPWFLTNLPRKIRLIRKNWVCSMPELKFGKNDDDETDKCGVERVHTDHKIDFFSLHPDKWCYLMGIERPTNRPSNWQINDSWLSGIVEHCDLCRQAGSQAAIANLKCFVEQYFSSKCLFLCLFAISLSFSHPLRRWLSVNRSRTLVLSSSIHRLD